MIDIETLAKNIQRTCCQSKLRFYGNCAVMNNFVVNHPTREAREKISMLSTIVPENSGDYERLTGSMVAPVIEVLKKACENGDSKMVICFRSKIWGNYNRVYVASYKDNNTTPAATATETQDDVLREGDAEFITVVVDVSLLAMLCHNRKIDEILINRHEKSLVFFFSGKYSQVPVTILTCYVNHSDNFKIVAEASKDIEALDHGSNVSRVLEWWLSKSEELA